MATRTFQRLLGETNLERKCRWLLGAGTLALMSGSFLLYARLTEDLAFDQLTNTGRTLVSPIVARLHASQNDELKRALEEFQGRAEETWPESLKGYRYRLLIPSTTEAERQPEADDAPVLHDFTEHPERREAERRMKAQKAFVYYGAIRAGSSCLECHRSEVKLAAFFDGSPAAADRVKRLVRPDLQPEELMAAVRITLSTEVIEDGLHTNRAWLFAFAIGTTLLILAGIYAIIRFVVVKPVKALKVTADAIAAGDYAVRTDLQTGDEFEDLSQAFNRMLANIAQIQERNRTLIAQMDGNVDELARTNMELDSAGARKTEYLATMSHELRTPLNSVIGFSEALIAAENLTDKQRRWMANIHDSGKHLLSLINDVLDLAKLESGKMRAKAEVIHLPTLLEEVASLFRHQADKKNIELVVSVPAETPDIRQDGGKLRQILSNLLSNAVKFTPDGGLITATARVEGGSAIFRIADTGIGIAAEHQGVIFQKFRQSSMSLTREAGGTGLGLSIVRELARLLGGDVSLTSELGRGSTFTVTVSAKIETDPLAAFADEIATD